MGILRNISLFFRFFLFIYYIFNFFIVSIYKSNISILFSL